MPFSDIEGTTHEENIADLAAAGVVSGFEDGTFGPSENVSRGQNASMIANALDLAKPGWRPHRD